MLYIVTQLVVLLTSLRNLIISVYNKKTLWAALYGKEQFLKSLIVWAVIPEIIAFFITIYTCDWYYSEYRNGLVASTIFIPYIIILLPLSLTIISNCRFNIKEPSHARATIMIYCIIIMFVAVFFIAQALSQLKMREMIFGEVNPSAVTFWSSFIVVNASILFSFFVFKAFFPSPKKPPKKSYTLTNSKIKQKEKRLEQLQRITNKGKVHFLLKYSVRVSLLLSLLFAIKINYIIGIILFIPFLIIFSILGVSGYNAMSFNIGKLQKEIETKNYIAEQTLSKFQWLGFLLIIFSMITPLFYQKELLEWSEEIEKYITNSPEILNTMKKLTPSIDNDTTKIKTVELDNGFTLYIPKDYISRNKIRFRTSFFDAKKQDYIFLNTMLPDLLPWKPTKELIAQHKHKQKILSRIKENASSLEESDANYIMLLITSAFNFNSTNPIDIYKEEVSHALFNNDFTIQDGLKIYNYKTYQAPDSKGRRFRTTKDFIVPKDKSSFMYLTCTKEGKCILARNYKGIGIMLRFSKGILGKWKDIEIKSNNLIDEFLKKKESNN